MSWGREALRSHVRVARSRKSDVRSSLPQEKRIPVVPSGDSIQLDFMPNRFKTLCTWSFMSHTKYPLNQLNHVPGYSTNPEQICEDLLLGRVERMLHVSDILKK